MVKSLVVDIRGCEKGHAVATKLKVSWRTMSATWKELQEGRDARKKKKKKRTIMVKRFRQLEVG